MYWRWIFHRPACSQVKQHNFRWFQEDSPRHYPQGIAIGTNHKQRQFVLFCLWQSQSQKKNLEFWDVFSRFCPNFKPFWKEPTCFKAVAHVRSFAPEATVDGLHPGAFGLKKKTRCLRGRKMCWNLKSLLCVHKWKTGFNPIENISQNGESSPKRGEHGKNIETTT